MSNKHAIVRKNIQFRDKLFVINSRMKSIWDYYTVWYEFVLSDNIQCNNELFWINRIYKNFIEKK